MDEIDVLFDKYYELFPIQKVHKEENECKHEETTSDDSHYYIVCMSCEYIMILLLHFHTKNTIPTCY
jgi:hypothetical protein